MLKVITADVAKLELARDPSVLVNITCCLILGVALKVSSRTVARLADFLDD